MAFQYVSLRESLKGNVSDFLQDENMHCTHTENGLVEIINSLSLYREEGNQLYPKVFIVDKLDTILKILSSNEHIAIGSGKKNNETISAAMKKCAPLAQGGWAIYIVRKPRKFEYGLIRNVGTALTMSIEDALVNNGDETVPVIMTHQVSDKTVEVKGASGNILLVHFGTTKWSGQSPVEEVSKFISQLTSDVSDKSKESATTFYNRLFSKVLKEGHGTLAITVHHDTKSLSSGLRDGIAMKSPIDVQKRIEKLISDKTVNSNSRLEACSSLIGGMLQSDGVTVFDTRGAVLAYNVFIKHPSRKGKQSATGGARSRTYHILSSMVGKKIDSVFMQSQDGEVFFKGARK